MTSINIFAIIIYIFFSLFILQRHKRYFVFFGFLTFIQSWALVSCLYNDSGIYNIELFRMTVSTFATTRLVMFYIIFNLGFLSMAKLIGRRNLTNTNYSISKETLSLKNIKLVGYAVIALVIAYIAYSFATEGIPLLSGLHRRAFFEQANRLERLLIVHGFVFAFALGYFRKKVKLISFNGFLLLLYIVFAVLIGNKFSAFLLLIIPYFAPIYARHYFDRPQLKLFKARYIITTLVVIAIFGTFAFGSYFYVMDDANTAFNYFINRVFAFEGEMWWAADYGYYNNNLYDANHFQVELENIFAPGSVTSSDVGMQYLMVKTLGPEKAFPIIESGYLYTMTYPAILIATFPYAVALLIQFFAGLFFFVILYYFHYTIIYRHAFRAIVTVVILIPYLTVLSSGNFAVFCTFGMVIKVLILLLLEAGSSGLLRRNL